jgi:hypothetical protein
MTTLKCTWVHFVQTVHRPDLLPQPRHPPGYLAAHASRLARVTPHPPPAPHATALRKPHMRCYNFFTTCGSHWHLRCWPTWNERGTRGEACNLTQQNAITIALHMGWWRWMMVGESRDSLLYQRRCRGEEDMIESESYPARLGSSIPSPAAMYSHIY